MWEIRLALRRVGSVKNEIIVSDMEDIYEYLAKDNRLDKEEVKKTIKNHDDHEH